MTTPDSSIIVEIDGKRYEVTPDRVLPVANEADSFEIKDNGSHFEFNIISYDPVTRTIELWVNGQPKKARIIRDIDLMIESMGLNATHAKRHDIITAPMPGLVSDIKVQAGDDVEKGTPLLILEAMKMENVISAPHDTTIKTIFVKKGQTVDRGAAMIELE